eukprot:1243299-Amphidinium_carterae.1
MEVREQAPSQFCVWRPTQSWNPKSLKSQSTNKTIPFLLNEGGGWDVLISGFVLLEFVTKTQSARKGSTIE